LFVSSIVLFIYYGLLLSRHETVSRTFQEMMAPQNDSISLLHIDDDPGYAKSVYDSAYKSSGGRVTLTNAGSLEKAIKIFTVITFDAVVVDLDLPDCFGVEIIRKFRGLHPDVPVIVLTDVDDEPTIIKAYMEGVREYVLKKDFSGRMFSDQVKRALGGKTFSDKYKGLSGLFHHNENYLSAIVSNIDIGIVVVNKKNLVVFANAYAGRLLETGIQKLIGSEFAYPAGPGNSVELELTQNNRNKLTLEMKITELKWDREPAYLVLLDDITGKKAAETNIEMLAKIQAENPNPFLRINDKNSIVYANDAGVSLMNRWDCTFFSALPSCLTGPIQTCQRNKNKRVLEVPCGRRTYLFNVVPVRKENHINLYGTDITQLKRLENTLREGRDRYQALLISG
jgi:ActR/RegA family two-component response regulator